MCVSRASFPLRRPSIAKNSYDHPRVHPAGIAHVLVNGVFVVEDAALTGARPGRVIRD